MVRSPDVNQVIHQNMIVLSTKITMTERGHTVVTTDIQNTIKGAHTSLRNKSLEIYRKEMNLLIGLKRKIKGRNEMLLSQQALVSTLPFLE
jgi:hypothetical protein